jgi:hypothetical protein
VLLLLVPVAHHQLLDVYARVQQLLFEAANQPPVVFS